MTVFISDMDHLPTNHPDVYQQFLHGWFTVQMKTQNLFGRNEMDKCIENTINKDTKIPGGLARFSTNIGAIDRWTLNTSRRAECRRILHQLFQYQSKRIDIVFDVYREISVKNTERSRRNKTSINVLRSSNRLILEMASKER